MKTFIALAFLAFMFAVYGILQVAYVAPHRNAQYVRDHHCWIDQVYLATRDWSSAQGKEEYTSGFKAYKCPGFSEFEWVTIQDNEEQP